MVDVTANVGLICSVVLLLKRSRPSWGLDLLIQEPGLNSVGSECPGKLKG
jgi:hypothetical protein